MFFEYDAMGDPFSCAEAHIDGIETHAEAPSVPKTTMPRLMLVDPSKLAASRRDLSNAPCVRQVACLRLGDTQPSEILATELLSPLTELPRAPCSIRGAGYANEQDPAQVDVLQQFKITPEYTDSIMGAPGQMIMLQTPESMATDMPVASARGSGGSRLWQDDSFIHDADVLVIPMVTPSGMAATTEAGNLLHLREDSDSSASTQRECGSAHGPCNERPCLLGHCVCDAAVSLCGRLQRVFQEQCSKAPFPDDIAPGAVPIPAPMAPSILERMACVPSDTVDEQRRRSCEISIEPASQTVCNEAMVNEAVMQSSPAPPGLPREFAGELPDHRMLLCDRELAVGGFAEQPSAMRSPRSGSRQLSWAEVDATHQAGTVDLAGSPPMQSELDAVNFAESFHCDLETVHQVAGAMTLRVQNDDALPAAPPRQPLGELNRDLSHLTHPGAECRGLLGLASALKSPLYVDPPLVDRYFSPQHMPQMPTPPAARYAGEKVGTGATGRRSGRRRERRPKGSEDAAKDDVLQQEQIPPPPSNVALLGAARVSADKQLTSMSL